jgi:Tfp pilus assembly protein PilX
MSATTLYNGRNKGVTLILSMIFVLVFSALAVSFATWSGGNVQAASNQHKVNSALYAAQSGLACARYIAQTVSLGETPINYVTTAQANTAWASLGAHLQSQALDGMSVPAAHRFTDALGSGDEIVTPAMNCGNGYATFTVRFYRYDSNALTIKTQASGTDGSISRHVSLDMNLTKDREVLTYAVASRGRMWLAGDTTIHGDLYSSYGRKYGSYGSYSLLPLAPFNTTSDSRVEGTVNTILTRQEVDTRSYQLETLNNDDKPMFTFGATVYDEDGHVVTDSYGTIDDDGYLVDTHGDPVFDADGNRVPVDYANRVYSSADELQGYHENVNYGQPAGDMPGMDISDYDTDTYTSGLSTIPSTSNRVTEYFPHAAGNYGAPSSSGSLRLTRYVYENQTYSNAFLPCGRQALFRNCTFEGVLYIDCYKNSTSSTSYTNNVRFENCNFNGVIVTNVPQPFNWQRNCLYFTGEAAFNNQSSIQEATILAPHFNVNLGNTNPQQSDNNVLTGAIIGGIVDVRGNAQIYGTIISMADTSSYTSGYVTNIGATLDDGGSETTELGDIGVIGITPEEEMMLPSGITSPIILKPDNDTYGESA